MLSEIVPKKDSVFAVLGAGFLLAAVHQYLFFGNAIGVSFPIFMVLFYVYMLYYSREVVHKPTAISYVWLSSIFLLSLTYLLFHNPFFYSLNLLVVPILIILHMTYMLHSPNTSWASATLIVNAVEHLFPQVVKHWANIMVHLKKSAGQNLKEGQKEVYRKVLIGLVISCPLLLVVIALLSSADGIFNELLSGIPHWLD